MEVLEPRYRNQYQTEVFQVLFRVKVRVRGEPLQALAYDLEQLVHKAYPGGGEATRTMLLCEHFVDALHQADTCGHPLGGFH